MFTRHFAKQNRAEDEDSFVHEGFYFIHRDGTGGIHDTDPPGAKIPKAAGFLCESESGSTSTNFGVPTRAEKHGP